MVLKMKPVFLEKKQRSLGKQLETRVKKLIYFQEIEKTSGIWKTNFPASDLDHSGLLVFNKFLISIFHFFIIFPNLDSG